MSCHLLIQPHSLTHVHCRYGHCRYGGGHVAACLFPGAVSRGTPVSQGSFTPAAERVGSAHSVCRLYAAFAASSPKCLARYSNGLSLLLAIDLLTASWSTFAMSNLSRIAFTSSFFLSRGVGLLVRDGVRLDEAQVRLAGWHVTGVEAGVVGL